MINTTNTVGLNCQSTTYLL